MECQWTLATSSRTESSPRLKIDICLLSGTHFINKYHNKFQEYRVYYTKHLYNAAKGGSAIIRINCT